MTTTKLPPPSLETLKNKPKAKTDPKPFNAKVHSSVVEQALLHGGESSTQLLPLLMSHNIENVYVYAYVYVYVYGHGYVYVCVYVYIFMYIYIYIYRYTT